METVGEGGEKEDMTKEKDRRKEDDRKRKTAAKVSFLRQYYPDAHSSPGGSIQISRQRNSKNILSTDGNSDREAGKSKQENIVQETSSQYNFAQSLPLSKRKTETIHTDETFSSPSKRQKLSTFSKKLQFWSSKDTPSGSDIVELPGELKWKPEGQGNWRQDRV